MPKRSSPSLRPRRACRSFGVILAAIVLFPSLLRSAEVIPDRDCLECHSDRELTKTNAVGRSISLFIDEAIIAKSTHATNGCASCHIDITRNHPDDNVPARSVDCASCHLDESHTYDLGIHAEVKRRGDEAAASCKDCHGSHQVLSARSPESPLHRSRLAKTCGECHDEVARELEESIHGQAVAKGLREPPTCTDCHAEHQTEALKGGSTLRVAEEVCSRCHASERMNTKYNLPRDRVRTFFKSYHGLAVQFGSTRAANCASCHGYHRILPASDARSSIHPDNLVDTCGQCHPGATEYFVQGRIHADEDDAGNTASRWNWWVKRIYIVLIIGTVGFMGAHNLLLLRRKLQARRQSAGATILRMDRNQRFQHLVLLISFFFLAVTGFALEYPHSWLARIFVSDDIRRWCHRIAGVVLLLVGGYHVFYVSVSQEGRRLLRDLWPQRQDGSALLAALRYLLKPGAAKPAVGRFGYAEKMEYWAVIWGSIIMGVTGLMIWFKLPVTQFLPRWVVDVASTIHFYEAILAILAILVWHIYHVIFDPDVYPGNTAWLNGRVSKHWYQEEHALDAEVLREETPVTASASSSLRPESTGAQPTSSPPGSA